MTQKWIEFNGRTFDVHGCPDMAKAVQIPGPQAQRIADLQLHREDLFFVQTCLQKIGEVSKEQDPDLFIRNALWFAAIVRLCKCFGRGQSRFALNPKDVFKGEREMQEDYEFFSDLRNKNLVHDENTWSQCVTAAVLNKRDCDMKIGWTFCFGVLGHTLSKENIPKLSRLAQRAVDWVSVRWEAEHSRLAAELEQRAYDELDSLGPIQYEPPGDRDAHTPKPRE